MIVVMEMTMIVDVDDDGDDKDYEDWNCRWEEPTWIDGCTVQGESKEKKAFQ